MTNTVSTILGIIGVIAGLITIAASTVAFFRANLAKAQIQDLRNDRDDEKIRGDRLERDLNEERTLRKTLEEKVRVLEQVVTGKEELEHISAFLINHDRRVDERHTALSGKVEGIKKTVDDLVDVNLDLVENYKGLHDVMMRSLTETSKP